MKRLLLMRHAKSSWRNAQLPDHERPLNNRGKKAAPYMGRYLLKNGYVPDMIFSSSAVRAVETAKGVVSACEFDGPLEITRRLYLADPHAYIDLLTEVPEHVESVLMIGHNPGISELVAQLAGQEQDLPTAALACFELDVDELASADMTTEAQFAHFHRPPRDKKKK